MSVGYMALAQPLTAKGGFDPDIDTVGDKEMVRGRGRGEMSSL